MATEARKAGWQQPLVASPGSAASLPHHPRREGPGTKEGGVKVKGLEEEALEHDWLDKGAATKTPHRTRGHAEARPPTSAPNSATTTGYLTHRACHSSVKGRETALFRLLQDSMRSFL